MSGMIILYEDDLLLEWLAVVWMKLKLCIVANAM